MSCKSYDVIVFDQTSISKLSFHAKTADIFEIELAVAADQSLQVRAMHWLKS